MEQGKDGLYFQSQFGLSLKMAFLDCNPDFTKTKFMDVLYKVMFQ